MFKDGRAFLFSLAHGTTCSISSWAATSMASCWGPPLVVNRPFFFEKMKERKREVRSGRKKEHYIEKERGRVCVCMRACVHIEIICLLGHMAQPDLLPFSLIILVKTSVFNVSSFVAKMR